MPTPAGPAAAPAERPAATARLSLAAGVRAVLIAPLTGRAWRELAYLAVGAPLALAHFVAAAVLLLVGGLLAVTLVGIPIVAATLLAARHLGDINRRLVGSLLGHAVEPPPPLRFRPGLVGWLRTALTDLAGWRGLAYVVVSFPLKVVGMWAVGVTWAVGLVSLTYPVWWRIPDAVVAQRASMQFGDTYMDTWPRALLVAALGLTIVLVVPWLTRLLVTVDRFLVGALLGPGRLSRRVSDLEQTRAHAVDDSAAALRRIERDLHDGTQARLVALAMHLDMAREQMTDRDGDARALLDTAHRNATDAITELRDVTRRIHPPALDQGLDHALSTLAARSRVPVGLRTDVPVRPSPAVETIAYFCAAELLANVTKHSGARQAQLDVVQLAGVLRVQVTDDGSGGATALPGHGLAGLTDRVRTIDGEMTVTSPHGGPTLVTVDLPIDR